MLKRCFKCQCEKPLDDFYKHSAMGDGRLGKCKECTKNDANKHRQENLERIRLYDKMRASMPHRIALRERVIKRWGAKHPERKYAAGKVAYALKSGKLTKQPCHVCGNQKSEGHHPDYSRPLDVVWLCRPHHMQAHALVANDAIMRNEAA